MEPKDRNLKRATGFANERFFLTLKTQIWMYTQTAKSVPNNWLCSHDNDPAVLEGNMMGEIQFIIENNV